MRKRILSLIIAALLSASALILLSACGGQGESGETTPAETTVGQVEIDLSEYRIIRPNVIGSGPLSEVVRLRKSLGDILGSAVPIFDDWVKNNELTDEILAEKEILVGRTNRPQSQQALDEAGGDGAFYVIAVRGPKIIVSASTDDLLGDAISAFLAMVDGKTLKLPANYLMASDPVPVLKIIENGESEFKIVYHEGLDTTAGQTSEKDKCDLEVQAAKDLRDIIKSASGTTILLSDDWVKPGEDTSGLKEILIGFNVNREETSQFLSSIGYDEYGYAVIGNKVVVAGWNLTTTEAAFNEFYNFMSSAAKTSKTVAMTPGYRLVKSVSGYFTDFPQYPDGDLDGTYDCNDSQIEFMYKNTSLSAYTDYLKTLENAGFKLNQSNDIAGNKSATYVGEKGMLHVMFVPTEKAVRIISAPDGKYLLPEYATADQVPAFTMITEPKITQMSFNYDAGNFGMCYIITLSDGSFIVFDSGGYNTSYGDDARLYNALEGLNKRTDGKIVIAAWIVTHEHWDHFLNFCNMATAHSAKIVIEKAYFNFPAAAGVTNSNNPNYYYTKNFPALSVAFGGIPTVKLHTGMTFCIRDAEFEVLSTQEDIFPNRCNYFNETTTVTRMKLGGNTVMWLGDAKNTASKVMTNRYGRYIESDIVQVAHHGYDGIQQSAYVLMKGRTLLWPTSLANFESQITGKTYAVDKYLFESVGSDKSKIIVADKVRTITLPFANGDPIVTETY